MGLTYLFAIFQPMNMVGKVLFLEWGVMVGWFLFGWFQSNPGVKLRQFRRSKLLAVITFISGLGTLLGWLSFISVDTRAVGYPTQWGMLAMATGCCLSAVAVFIISDMACDYFEEASVSCEDKSEPEKDSVSYELVPNRPWPPPPPPNVPFNVTFDEPVAEQEEAARAEAVGPMRAAYRDLTDSQRARLRRGDDRIAAGIPEVGRGMYATEPGGAEEKREMTLSELREIINDYENKVKKLGGDPRPKDEQWNEGFEETKPRKVRKPTF